MLINKTKLDNTFHTAKFLFKVSLVTYRLTQSMNCLGIIVFVTEIMEAKFLNDHRVCNNADLCV